MRLLAISLSLAGGLAAYGAVAQVTETDADIDTDGDSMYSLEELSEFHPNMVENDFVKADVDGDGFLSQEEYANALSEAVIDAQHN